MLIAKWIDINEIEHGRVIGRDSEDIRRLIVVSLSQGEDWEPFGATGDKIVIEKAILEVRVAMDLNGNKIALVFYEDDTTEIKTGRQAEELLEQLQDFNSYNNTEVRFHESYTS